MRRALVGLLVMGCHDAASPPSPRSGRDAAAPAVANHIDAVIDGKPMALRAAKAVAGASDVFAPEGLTIRLTAAEVPCGTDDHSPAPLEIDVPPGPQDRYFTGQAVAARVYTEATTAGLPDVPPWSVQLALDPFDAEVGGHVTGTIDVDSDHPSVHVHGRLDAPICETPRPVGLPASAPATAFAGTWSASGDRKGAVSAATALAMVEHGPEDVVARIELFNQAGVTCAQRRAHDDNGFLATPPAWVLDVGAVRTARPPLGTVLAARIMRPSADSEILDAHAWLRIDALDLDQGELRATLAARRHAAGIFQIDAAGTIVATLCPPLR